METTKHNQEVKTLEDFKRITGSTNEYHFRNAENYFKLADKMREFAPCETVLHREGDTHLVIMLDRSDEIIFNQTWNNQLSIFSWKKFKYVDHDDISRIKKDLETPKNFKVMSQKKVDDWIKYTREVLKKAEELSNERHEKIQAFLKKVAGIARNCEVKKTNNGAYITGKNFTFYYEINESSGFISQEIRRNEYSNDVSEFERLNNLK